MSSWPHDSTIEQTVSYRDGGKIEQPNLLTPRIRKSWSRVLVEALTRKLPIDSPRYPRKARITNDSPRRICSVVSRPCRQPALKAHGRSSVAVLVLRPFPACFHGNFHKIDGWRAHGWTSIACTPIFGYARTTSSPQYSQRRVRDELGAIRALAECMSFGGAIFRDGHPFDH